MQDNKIWRDSAEVIVLDIAGKLIGCKTLADVEKVSRIDRGGATAGFPAFIGALVKWQKIHLVQRPRFVQRW